MIICEPIEVTNKTLDELIEETHNIYLQHDLK